MPNKKISFDMIDNYISDKTAMPDEDDESNDCKKFILDIFNENLTKRQRCCIMLYYRDRLTMQQIADKLNVNKSTVSRVIANARKRVVCGMKTQLLMQAIGMQRSDKDVKPNK